MVDKVERLRPLLEGRASLVPTKKIRPDILQDYLRTHQKVGRNIIIPKSPEEKVTVVKGMPQASRVLSDNGKRKVVRRRIPLPIDIDSLDAFVDDLRNRPDKWIKRRGDYPPWVFGFKIGHGYSSAVFESAELLAEELERYRELLDDNWDLFELWAIDEVYGLPWSREQRQAGTRRASARKRKPVRGFRLNDQRIRKQKERARMSEDKLEIVRKKNAERMARLRANPKYRAKEMKRDKSAKAAMRRELGMLERKPKKSKGKK